MIRIVLDATLKSKLADLVQPLELYDESGRLLGRFTPAEPQLSEEELQRREQEPEYSTEEVLAHLEKL